MNIEASKAIKLVCKKHISLFVALIVCLILLPQISDAATATPTTVTMSWTATGDDGNVGTATTYDIRYSTSAITPANWDDATLATGEPNPQISGTTETFTVTDLTPSTLYYFAIKASDEVPNWSNLSNVLSISTLPEDNAPGRIAGLNITGSAPNSVSLAWTAPGDDDESGTATTYDIRYSTALITVSNWDAATQVTGEPSPQIAGSSESFTVTGLSENTQYYFAVMTADEVPNWSPLSNIVSTTTGSEQNAPDIIANLSTGTVTATSVVLSWTAPGDDGDVGTASEYDIRYSTSPITSGNWDAATQVTGESNPQSAGSTESFTVNGLTSGTQYYFAIRTADEVPNWADMSNVVNATTLDNIPPAAITTLAQIDIWNTPPLLFASIIYQEPPLLNQRENVAC